MRLRLHNGHSPDGGRLLSAPIDVPEPTCVAFSYSGSVPLVEAYSNHDGAVDIVSLTSNTTDSNVYVQLPPSHQRLLMIFHANDINMLIASITLTDMEDCVNGT